MIYDDMMAHSTAGNDIHDMPYLVPLTGMMQITGSISPVSHHFVC
jgi:hypothetical protein